MQFIVTENISQPYAIESETAEAAIKARQNGEGTALPSRNQGYNVQARPQAREKVSPEQVPVATPKT